MLLMFLFMLLLKMLRMLLLMLLLWVLMLLLWRREMFLMLHVHVLLRGQMQHRLHGRVNPQPLRILCGLDSLPPPHLTPAAAAASLSAASASLPIVSATPVPQREREQPWLLPQPDGMQVSGR